MKHAYSYSGIVPDLQAKVQSLKFRNTELEKQVAKLAGTQSTDKDNPPTLIYKGKPGVLTPDGSAYMFE